MVLEDLIKPEVSDNMLVSKATNLIETWSEFEELSCVISGRVRLITLLGVFDKSLVCENREFFVFRINIFISLRFFHLQLI